MNKDDNSQQNKDNTVVSGILYTRDLMYNRPYYMINYQDDKGATLSKMIAKNVTREFMSPRCFRLVSIAKEVEEAFPETDAFSIEFKIDDNENVTVTRTSPLEQIIDMPRPMTDKEFYDTKSLAKCVYLDTNHILSDKAFWNPLDKIGTNPRPLDYSLFREVITENIWNSAIVRLGYTEINGELMQKVGNKPYISMNNTYEALTPAGIPSKLRFKLQQYYESELRDDKANYEKIQTEDILNVYDFVTDSKLKNLLDMAFSVEEVDQIKQGLYDITHNILSTYDKIHDSDYRELQQLIDTRRKIQQQQPEIETNVMKLYKQLTEMLSSIKTYGAPQYARQERCQFLAKRLCDSLVESGYFTRNEMEDFIASITTASTELKRDLFKYTHGLMTADEFNEIYGDLRSGAFDIRTDCYKHIKLDTGSFKTSDRVHNIAVNSTTQGKLLDSERLKKAILDANINITPEKLIDFIVRARKNKEVFRFEFNKSMSLMLEIISRMGDVMGIAKEDMSYLEIYELLSYHSRDSYIQTIQTRRDMYHNNTYLVLPDIIFGIGDIDVVTSGRKLRTMKK